MTCQAHRSPAPALEVDARAVTLLETARMQNGISDVRDEAKQALGN